MTGLQETLSRCRTEDENEPESTCLYLPSDLSQDDRNRLGFVALAQTELELRKGDANDAIRMLRTQINLKNSLESQKRTHSRGTKDNTRSSKIVQDVGREIKFLATTYRSARKAIVALGGDGVKAYPM